MVYGTRHRLRLGWVTLLAILLSACSGGREAALNSQAGYPAKAISIMAPAAPGGGWDQTARAMQTALAVSTGQNVQVYNVAGAGGTVGLAQFVNDQAGDPHQLMVGATETNRSPVTLEQVTPIATLTAEWEAITVSANSPYQTFQQLLDAFKARPASISWGGGSAGGVDHILIALIAKAADPEAANNAAFSGVLVPLLTLGLPTSATAAILLAAFQIYHLQPGPLLFQHSPQLVWALIASLYLGNVMLLVLNLPLVRIWVRLLAILRPLLSASILVFATLGVYSLANSVVDVLVMYTIGVLGFFMRRYDFPVGPTVLGVILMPLAETQFRRALAISQGDGRSSSPVRSR